MDISLIQGTIATLKTASDIAKSFIKLKSTSEIQGKIIELQQAILAAQSCALSANADQLTMIEEMRQLKEELSRIKAWESQKLRYKLHAPWEGAVVCALKQSSSEGEPPHWKCTNCYEDGKKSILNQTRGKDREYLLTWPACNSQVQSPWIGPHALQYAAE